MASKPWGGRFKQATDASVELFTESISYDSRLYTYDIQGSIAHANMLSRVGLLTGVEKKKIVEGLKFVGRKIESGKVEFDPAFEDIHMFVEHLLTQKIGSVGKKLHTARSRNDQVATDMRLWLADVGQGVVKQLRQVQKVLLKKAKAYESVIMPGFTHLQHAQPISVAHYCLAFVEKFDRDLGRVEDTLKRADNMPLGSCALAGTTLPIDRKLTAKELGFSTISRNSMDSVSDRDFLIEYNAALSLIATHISNFCEDMVVWASAEYGYIRIDDGYCTGSSIMPQKKNPDVHELLRGKTARVHGSLVALLTLMKGLPQAYNRDMQEDKERIFDAHDTVDSSLNILAQVISHTHFNREVLWDSTRKGFTEATALAEYLVIKNVFFRDAHRIVGLIVQLAEKNNCTLDALSLKDLQIICPKIEKDVYKVLEPTAILKMIKSTGGTGVSPVRATLSYWNRKLTKTK